MSATLGDLTWELSTNQPTTFNGFSHSTSKDHPGQRISTKEKVDLTLKTIGFARKVKSVTIYTSASNYVNCGVTVGSTTYKCNNNSAYPIEKTTKGYTFIGDGEGDITIIWKQQDKGCDIYIYKIKVDYVGDNDKADQHLSFPQKSYTAILENGFTLPQVSGSQTTLTYSSSQPDIASIDAQTGKITLKEPGQTVITATAAADKKYNSAQISFTLNVKSQFVHQTLFNFIDIKSFGLDFPQSSTSAYMTARSIHSNDIVIMTNDENNYFRNTEGLVRLQINKNKEMTFIAPYGMMIKAIRLTGEHIERLQVDGSKIADGIWNGEANSVTFTTIDGVVSLASATVDYYGAYKQKISDVGYATLSTAQAYVMPDGLKGGIVSVSNNTANVRFCYLPGDIVPAQEALVLKGTAGEYSLTPTSTSNPKHSDNQLLAANNNDKIQFGNEFKLLILSRDQEGKLGFYYQKGCPDGSFLQDVAHKAYLKLPQSMFANPQKGLRLNIVPTGISSPLWQSQREAIYDLGGNQLNLPLSTLSKGIYIINGKKIFIK